MPDHVRNPSVSRRPFSSPRHVGGDCRLAAFARHRHAVYWGTEDFAFAAILLIGAGLLFELAAWKLTTTRARLVAGGLLVLAVALVWAEAAVGLF
jgi:hypothetical protein